MRYVIINIIIKSRTNIYLKIFMNINRQSIQKSGITLLVGVVLMATMVLWQRAAVIIKDAIRDGSKMRPTADRCNESQNSNEPHFTGCSSIL